MRLGRTWYQLFEEMSPCIFIDTCNRKLAFVEYFYCLRRTDIFTCHTKYTVFFSYHESLFVRCRMAWRFKPFVDIDRARFNTCSVCNADVKVYAYFLTPYAQLSWWVNWPFCCAVACSCASE